MSTVQLQMAKLYQRIDPRASDGSEITPANVGTVDGEKFSAAKSLVIYNDARVALANAISIKLDPVSKKNAVANNVIRTTLTFGSGAAPKPVGYVENISILTPANVIVSVLPSYLAGTLTYLDTLQNPIVFEEATQFYSQSGTSIVNGAGYIFRYFGITAFVGTDVTNGTTVETFQPIWEPMILELGEAIAIEQGLAEVNKLAMVLVGGQA